MAFPEAYIINVIIPATNDKLTNHMTLQEFYCWLGCNFVMCCFKGVVNQEEWWSTKAISINKGAPFRLTPYMAKGCCLLLTGAMTYTNNQLPNFEDNFFDLHQIIAAFSIHYESNYNPSWLNCLDKSMSSWLNQLCPRFMYVPCKPHPSGNEYHSITGGDQGKPIMWQVKLQEWKDRPKDANGHP